MERPEIFYTYQWAKSVQRAYAEELVPWTLLRYEGEQLTGAASLAIEAKTGRATFLANTTADYCDVLSEPADRANWLHVVFQTLRESDVTEIVLPNLPAESATVRALRAASSKFGYRLFLRDAYLCAQVQLGSDNERQDLKKAVQKQKIFRRGLNFLRRQGQVTFVHRRSWSDIEPRLKQFYVAHIARFLAGGRISSLATHRRRLFLEELTRSLSEHGWLVFSQMMLDAVPMATNLGFQFRGSWFWYQPTFDMTHEQISPGYCLLSHIITEACDQPELDVIDLGLGAEGYKERVANSTRRTVLGLLTTSRRQLLAARTRYIAAQAAKASPVLERKIRQGLARCLSAQHRLQTEGLLRSAVWAVKRSATRFAGREEVIFYRWQEERNSPLSSPETRLEALNWDLLADAAMRFEADQDTQNYLLRAASRFKEEKSEGFVLLDKSGPLHFCWTAPMQAFYMAELRATLRASAPEDWLIFDCWTPVSLRGKGYYGAAVAMAAVHLGRCRRRPFIFSTVSNQSSIRGLQGTRFVPDFRLTGGNFLRSGKMKVLKVPYTSNAVSPELIDPRPDA